MPHKKLRPAKRWSMYPARHGQISSLLTSQDLFFGFAEDDDDKTCMRSCDTNVTGRFVCRNGTCAANGHGWESSKIAMTIRLYRGSRYNARVYAQRCKHCDAFSTPILDDSYSERVANRIKTWCRVKSNLSTRKGKVIQG